MPAPATMTQICCFEKRERRDLGGPEAEAHRGDGAPEDHGPLGPLAVEDAAADLGRTTKPMKKNSRKMPAFEAVSCSAICAYSLAKKKTGMNAIMAINKTRFSTAKGRMRKISTLMSGDSVRSSTRTKTPMIDQAGDDADPRPGIAPPPGHRLLQAEDAQPDTGRDEHRPPVVDRGPPELGLRLGHRDQDQRDEGDRDVHPEDGPPGPLGQEPAQNRADGGESSGDAEEQRQRLAALAEWERVDHDGERRREHERPPAPWTTRNVTIQASAPEPLGVSPHMADATTKTITPITHILVWPKMSESRPPRAKSAAREIR